MSSAPSTPKGQIMPEFPSSPPNKIGMFSRRDSFLDDPPFGYASRDIDSDSSDSPPPLRRNGIFRRGLTYPPPRTPRGTAQAPPTPPNSNPSSQVLGTAFEFKPSRKRGHENGASSQSSSKRARIYFSPMASDDEGVDDEETCVKPERSPTPLVERYMIVPLATRCHSY